MLRVHVDYSSSCAGMVDYQELSSIWAAPRVELLRGDFILDSKNSTKGFIVRRMKIGSSTVIDDKIMNYSD